MILKSFDPWNNRLCTCPKKLSLNPYTGCSHGCLYCYASSYIPRFWDCRPKSDLIQRLKRDASRVRQGTLVSASNSSDPYPPAEKELCLTRGCIEILKERGLRLQIVTKSDIVARDVDLLCEMRSMVAITLTTLEDDLAAVLEPGAPRPSKRLEAMRLLAENGIPVSARVDPIIPGINSGEIEDLASAAARAGARHITASTYKARSDNLKRLCKSFPEETRVLSKQFKMGDRVGGTSYLPESLRIEILKLARAASIENEMTFSACREGFFQEERSCDGSHLIGQK